MKEMIKAVKQYFAVEGGAVLASIVFLLLGGAGGIIISLILLAIEGSEGSATVGALLAMIVSLILAVFLGITELQQKFNLMISMGKTRKEFIFSFYILEVVRYMLYLFTISLISRFEVWFYRKLFPQVKYAIVVHDKIESPIVFGSVVLLLPVVILLFGSLLMRYGQKFYWIFWSLWMLTFMVVPRMFTAMHEKPDSLLGKMGGLLVLFVEGISPVSAVVAIFVLGGIAIMVVIKLVRTQHVTL